MILILLLCLLFVVGIFLLSGKNREEVNLSVISEYLEINLSDRAKFDYKDVHDSFFKEGYTIARIKDDGLFDKIRNSSHWRNNSDEYTSKMFGIINNMSNDYGEISEIRNYYWIYKHDYRGNNIKYIEEMDNNIETYSYLVGIYDVDGDILYYYHMDM